MFNNPLKSAAGKSKSDEFREVVDHTVTATNFARKWVGKFKKEEENKDVETGNEGNDSQVNEKANVSVAPMVRVSSQQFRQ